MPDAQMIGPYRLERVLGTGSFATVWLAYDDVLDRQVAVKILADNWSRDHDVRRRFLAEARVLLTVESPRIVRGFHIGESPVGQPYLVMAYADRGTLGDRIAQRRSDGRTFDPQETVGIATEVAYALIDVHASGQLHRDVKPTNVLIRSSSTRRNIAGLAADETVVLGDFGLARGLDLSALTMVAGSPGYVAPEQAGGLTQLDRRADLYPLGRMMLEMLTGDAGGKATTMAGAAAEHIDVAAVLGDVVGQRTGAPSRDLVDLVTRLVAKDPARRPSSAEEVAIALHGIAAAGRGDASGTPAPSGPPLLTPDSTDDRLLTGTQLAAAPARPGGAWWRDHRVVAAAVLAGLAAVVAIVVAVSRDGGGSAGGTTTAPAVVVVPGSEPEVATSPPDSTVAVAASATAEPLGRPISTAPPSEPAPSDVTTVASRPASSDVVATVAASSVPPGTIDSTVPSVASESGEPAQLALPVGSYTRPLGTTPPDPDRQEGAILMSADEFASALVETNPDWSGDPPAPDADGVVNFEMTGFGRTAAVHVEPDAETSGAVIVGFTIDYS